MFYLCPVHHAPVVIQLGFLVVELLCEFHLVDASLAAHY
jgi:hypothetical protein